MKNGIGHINRNSVMENNMELAQLKKKYKAAQTAYYAGEPIMSDSQFDKLEDRIRALDPKWSGLSKTGTNKISKKQKVKLPYFMPSLSKVYPEAVDKWVEKNVGGRAIVMAKLDGSSVQANYENGRLKSLITRGDGEVGQDITFLAPHSMLPRQIKYKKPISFRMEAVMKVSIFNSNFSEEAENPRNLVAGILNRKLTKESTTQLKFVDFIVLGVFGKDISLGFRKARELGFDVVPYKLTSKLKANQLSAELKSMREETPYEMDGLVLVGEYEVFEYKNNDRPKWAVAFKENLSEEDAPDAHVKDIIWQLSHSGRWTPKVQIDPIRMDGVTVKFATVHNAQWMIDRGIGPGSIIKLVRSGGVIPKIVGVVKKAKKLKMPPGEYVKKGVHFRAVERNADSDTKNITRFLSTCGVERVKLSTVKTMYEAGMESIEDFAQFVSFMKPSQAKRLQKMGFGAKQTQIIIEELSKLIGIPLQKAIVGSGVFEQGIGERRLAVISRNYPLSKLLTWSQQQLLTKVAAIHGFGDKTAAEIWSGIVKYRKLHAKIAELINIKVPTKVSTVSEPVKGKFNGFIAVWTGYRDKEQEQYWGMNGGIVGPGLNKQTTHLFYNPSGKFMAKVEKARASGIKVLTWDQLK